MMKRLMLATFLAFAPVAPAVAQRQSFADEPDSGSVGWLRRQCITVDHWNNRSDPMDLYAGTYCVGYLIGAVDILAALAAVHDCPDLLGTRGRSDQLRAMFVRWADSNPEQWHRPAAVGVVAMTAEACR
jgi:hypothetical protein